MIDFEKLLVVVRQLDALRFASYLSPSDAEQLRLLLKQFAELTDGRMVPPRPFRTDGCTLSTNRFGRQCCVLHDLAYWLGGTRGDRLMADRRLRECTCHRSRLYAQIQYAGVRIGGHPLAPDYLLRKEFRWGYGWDIYPQPGKPGTLY